MLAFVSLLLFITLSMLIVRIGTIALVMTGLSEDVASFQALSAFTGAGFTTSESENIVAHPVRRRIIRLLVMMGSAGIITTLSSLALAFTGTEGDGFFRLTLLVLGLVVLVFLARSQAIKRVLNPMISRVLSRWTELDLKDYASLLNVEGDYAVAEIEVRSDHWLASASLQELDLTDHGVLVLALKRPGQAFSGVPAAETQPQPGDRLVVYGSKAHLQSVCRLVEELTPPEIPVPAPTDGP